MKRIGLSQRVERVVGYQEVRDCLDRRWAAFFERLGAVVVPLASGVKDPERMIGALDLDGIVLTGGNDPAGVPGATNVSPERDRLERVALDVARREGMPVMGVCRGLQMINLYYGGRLERVDGHVAVRHDVVMDGAPSGWPGFVEVNSYHGNGIRRGGLGEGLRVVATDTEGNVEAVEHGSERVAAIMWHPEREEPFREDEMKLFRDFFKL